jgi:hypothetical protein
MRAYSALHRVILFALLLMSTGGAALEAQTVPAECPRNRPVGQWTRCIGTWTDPAGGLVYSGEFVNGIFHGQGVLIVGATRYAGEFRDGRMHGEGVLLSEDGRRYVGRMEVGAMSGFGRLLEADGREIFAGNFADGVPVAAAGNLGGAAPPRATPAAPPAPAPPPAPAAQPAAGSAFPVGSRVDVLWFGTWYAATVKAVEGPQRWRIGYDGYSSSSDESVGPDRIRARAAPTAAAPPPPPPAAPGRGGAPPPAAPVADRNAANLSWPALPRGASTPLEGAYLVVQTWFSGSSLSTSMESWFFTRNGRFSNAPSGGVTLQALSSKPNATRNEGTYRIENGQLILTWADGREPWTSRYTGEPQSLTIGNRFASKWPGFTKGWRMDGTYEGGASVGGGALASSGTLAFRRDGTFTRASSVSISTTGRTTEVSGGSTSSGGGTYEFDEYTLILRENGTEARFTVFAYGAQDAAGRPEQIFREGVMMKR